MFPIGSTDPGKGRAAQHHFFLSRWSWPWQKSPDCMASIGSLFDKTWSSYPEEFYGGMGCGAEFIPKCDWGLGAAMGLLFLVQDKAYNCQIARVNTYYLYLSVSLDWSITDVMYILYGHQWYQCNCRATLIWKRFHLLLKVERDGPGYGWKIGHSRPEIFSLIKQNSVDLQRFLWLNFNANFTCVFVWFNGWCIFSLCQVCLLNQGDWIQQPMLGGRQLWLTARC